MRLIYLIGAILTTTIGIILAFENITMKPPFFFFFSIATMPLTIPLFVMLIIGIASGFLYGLYFTTKEAASDDGDDLFE